MDELWVTMNALREYALSFPEAYEDHPWGEVVIKVSKKIFVFLGTPDNIQDGAGFGVKLPLSHQEVLKFDYVSLMGYGLGKAGWVSLKLSPDQTYPLELFKLWIEESYRAVAPKKLVAQIEQSEAAES